MLPWLQTRSPRVIEVSTNETPSILRRLNLAVLGRGSIQANTFPSGHAAGSVAAALAVSGPMPTAGLVFVVLAASIVAATVIGRYHYVVDSVLGFLVAVAAWSLLIPG
jgi:membrane-associated phospholipid phosphatase